MRSDFLLKHYSIFYMFSKKNVNASKPSEHTPVRGENVKTYIIAIRRYFQHAHFTPIVGVGKRGAD